MRTIVHVTHEAAHKIGGIGTVLEGLVTSRDYDAAVGRTIVLGPLFSRDGDADSRLGVDGEVLYSSLDGRYNHPLAPALREVQDRWGVQIVYGRKRFQAVDTRHKTSPEILLIDISHIDAGRLNLLKHRLYEWYGLASNRHEDVWEFEQYMRLAGPGLEAIRAIGGCGGQQSCIVVAHEFMGMPTALAAMAFPEYQCRTIFYAHEVATIRKLVEEHPGHDTMFYNVMRKARGDGLYLPDVFGPQDGYFKHPLVMCARHCDNILAVGDYVIEELRFLGPEFAGTDITLAYNGIPAHKDTADDDAAARKRLQEYAETLLGWKPDYVFTHVTRLVLSKGLWRDLAVLEHIDEAFRRDGRTAVLFVLSTEIGMPRRPADILHMEREWNWPLAHREGYPDLSGGEARFYQGVQAFNARSRNCKVVFINQFGFDRARCGHRMSEHIEFWDIRRGSDVEFGQSVYEPFGIAQVEALSYGALCVMNEVCGCAGFVRNVTGGKPDPNAIIVDYTVLDQELPAWRDGLRIGADQRLSVERRVARNAAEWILSHLPTTPQQYSALSQRGHDAASRMTWDVIARDYFLPAIERAERKQRTVVQRG